MAAATAARASRLASSSDVVGACVGRGGTNVAGVAASGAAFAVLDGAVPLAMTLGLAAGLSIGIAGMMRPLFWPLSACLAAAGTSLAAEGAEGASAAATSGFDSVGGGGPF